VSFPDIRRRWLAQARIERFEDIAAALQAKQAQLETEFTKALAQPDLAALGFRVVALRPQVELSAPDGTVIRFAEVGKYEARDASGRWARLGPARLRELTSGRVHGLQKLSDLALRLGQLGQDLARLPEELGAFAGEYRQRLEALSRAASPRAAEAAQQELDGFFAEHQEELPRCVEQELEDAKHQALLRGLFFPKPPTGVQATSHRSDCVKLIWASSAGAEQYLIYGSEQAPPAQPTFIDSVEGGKNEFEWRAAPPGREFYFYVTAKNQAGEVSLGQVSPARGRRTEPPPAGTVTAAVVEELLRKLKDAEEKPRREAEAREAARLAAEAEAKRLAQERHVAKDKAKAEAEACRLAEAKRLAEEEARLAAEAEAKRLAEEEARQEAEAREQARLAAEAEARRLAEEMARREAEAKRVAEEKRKAEEEAREAARLAAEAEAERLAEERRMAEEKAEAEEKVRRAGEAQPEQQPVSPLRTQTEIASQWEDAAQAERKAARWRKIRWAGVGFAAVVIGLGITLLIVLRGHRPPSEVPATGAGPPLVALTISVAPTNAEICMDGHRVTPDGQGVAQVAPGTRTIEARLAGYETNTTNVTVQSGTPMTVNLGTLQPLPVAVTVRVAPANAEIYVDGQRATLDRQGVAMVEPGTRTIEARLAGYESKTTNVVVQVGTPTVVALGALRVLPVAVTASVAPTNAEIYVDNQRVSRDRQGLLQVQPGTRTIEARLAGYETKTTTVVVQIGTPTRVDLGTLGVLPVPVTVSVAPTNAEIYVDKQRVTRDRQGALLVQPGTRRIEAQLGGFQPKGTNVKVQVGMPARLDLGTLLPQPVAATVKVGPANQLVGLGQVATLTVKAGGTEPLLYQWYKDGVKLVGSERVSGVESPTLTIGSMAKEDVGTYTVEVRNAWAVRLSQAATLSVGPPGFVWIPPGTFTMGSTATERQRFPGEGPQTVVTISKGFFMGRYEVTQGQYRAMFGTYESFFPWDQNVPVEQVDWFHATEYCGKLTEQERAAGSLPPPYLYRLPTEAEWEYACRAGTTTRFSYGDDLGFGYLTNYCWYLSNSGGKTHRVGQMRPNIWGLYDVHGNVWEWCLDWYGTYPGGRVTDPTGPASGERRVARGGGWVDEPLSCRSARRRSFLPGHRTNYIGFRVVLAPGQP